jgi:hypothetical protein
MAEREELRAEYVLPGARDELRQSRSRDRNVAMAVYGRKENITIFFRLQIYSTLRGLTLVHAALPLWCTFGTAVLLWISKMLSSATWAAAPGLAIFGMILDHTCSHQNILKLLGVPRHHCAFHFRVRHPGIPYTAGTTSS